MINATKVAQIFSVSGQFKPTKASAYLLTNLSNNGYYFDISSQTVIDSSNFSSLTDNAQRIFYTDVEIGYSGSGYLTYPSSIYSPIFSAVINVPAGSAGFKIIDHIDGKVIRVVGWYLGASVASGSYTWLSGGDAKTGVIPTSINSGVSTEIQFNCAVGEDLNITTIGSDIDGVVNYIIIDDEIDNNDILDAVVSAPAGSTGLKILDHINGRRIQIVGWYVVASVASGSYTLLSGVNAKTGDTPVGIGGGGTPNTQITCGISEDLNITTVGSKIDGIINYRVVDDIGETLDAVIDVAAGSTGLKVLDAVAGKKIKITKWYFGSSVASGTYTWLSNTDAKTGDIPVGINGGGNPNIQITCGTNEDLKMTTVGAKISGVINYQLVDIQDEIFDAIISAPANSVELQVINFSAGKKIQVVGWYVGASVSSGSYTLLSGTDAKTGIIPIGINGSTNSQVQITCDTDDKFNITTVSSKIDGVVNYKMVDDIGNTLDAIVNVSAGPSTKVLDHIDGKKIKITGWCVGSSVSIGSYTWLSAATGKTGVIPIGINGGASTSAQIICGTSEDLNITVVDSDIDGVINYTISEDPEDYNIVKYPIRGEGNHDLYVRLKDADGVGSCNIEVYIDDTLESTNNLTFAGTDWEWHSLGTFDIVNNNVYLANNNVYDLGIRLYTNGIIFDQIAINPVLVPAGNGVLTLTTSPFITAHMGVYNVDVALEPTTPLYIHDFKTSIEELRQDSWYNFDLSFIDSSLDDDFLSSYALYFSVSGSNNKNFITWERTDADAYSLEPSAYSS